MKKQEKALCRWLDSCMNCCWHPSTYERMEKLGVFAEFNSSHDLKKIEFIKKQPQVAKPGA